MNKKDFEEKLRLGEKISFSDRFHMDFLAETEYLKKILLRDKDYTKTQFYSLVNFFSDYIFDENFIKKFIESHGKNSNLDVQMTRWLKQYRRYKKVFKLEDYHWCSLKKEYPYYQLNIFLENLNEVNDLMRIRSLENDKKIFLELFFKMKKHRTNKKYTVVCFEKENNCFSVAHLEDDGTIYFKNLSDNSAIEALINLEKYILTVGFKQQFLNNNSKFYKDNNPLNDKNNIHQLINKNLFISSLY